MFRKKTLRILSALIAVMMLSMLSFSSLSAIKIGISPVKTKERIEEEFEGALDSLSEYLVTGYLSEYDDEDDDEDQADEDEDYSSEDEDEEGAFDQSDKFADWIEVLMYCYEELSDSLDSFIEVEEERNSESTDPETGENYYSKASLQSFIYGSEIEDDDATYKLKGVFTRSDSRFYVDNTSDLFFDDKEQHIVKLVDYAQGQKYLFIQYAFYNDYYEDVEAHCYDVLRMMIGNGQVMMSLSTMTEQELLQSRVKSVYASWDAFCLKDSDTFVYNGKSIELIEDGEKTNY